MIVEYSKLTPVKSVTKPLQVSDHLKGLQMNRTTKKVWWMQNTTIKQNGRTIELYHRHKFNFERCNARRTVHGRERNSVVNYF